MEDKESHSKEDFKILEIVTKFLKRIDDKKTYFKNPTEAKKFAKLSKKWILFNDANIYLKNKEYKKAIECYKKQLELDPNDSGTWFFLGDIYYYKLGKGEEGIKCFEKSLKIKPGPNIKKILKDIYAREVTYKNFRKYQSQMKLYVKPDNKDYKFLSQMDLTTINDYKDKIENDKIRNDVRYFIEIAEGEMKNLIPTPLRIKIRKMILELGVKYNRLQIAEIAEKCGEPEDCIILIAQGMIENKEIYAEYFKSTKSFAFDQRTNIDEIDDLMKKYEGWEKEKMG